MKTTDSWMIRSGQGGYLLEEFFEHNLIALGWNEVGSLSEIKNKEELKSLFASTYEDWSQGKINQCAGQLWRFYMHVKIGDNIVTYDSSSRQYYTGTVESEYEFNEKTEFFHTRKVQWSEVPIERDDLSIDSRNTLGSILTVFWISPEIFEDIKTSNPYYMDIDDKDIEAMNQYQEELHEEMEKLEMEQSLELLKEEAISRSLEFTKDILISLSWEDTEKLVAGLLRTMGYKTRFTSRGSDLGSDIMASPDVLGLEEPRIKVEVKKRTNNKISAVDLRNFIGGMRDYNKGIYVTTSGFTKEARYEAERANFPITLIDSDWLVELIAENYEELDAEVKALVPLKKIYWPV
ncbi:MAG: restriction endonuclease [Fluviicola sp.]